MLYHANYPNKSLVNYIMYTLIVECKENLCAFFFFFQKVHTRGIEPCITVFESYKLEVVWEFKYEVLWTLVLMSLSFSLGIFSVKRRESHTFTILIRNSDVRIGTIFVLFFCFLFSFFWKETIFVMVL